MTQDFVAQMVAEFDRRRRLMQLRLNGIEGFECCLPKGASSHVFQMSGGLGFRLKPKRFMTF